MAIPDAEISAVRFSLCVVAERYILQQVPEEVNRKCSVKHESYTMSQLSTLYTDPKCDPNAACGSRGLRSAKNLSIFNAVLTMQF